MFALAPQSADSHKTRILLVDDDERVRRMTRLMLSIEGFDVVEAESGRDAIEHFEDEPPDVVITDLCMPGEDGRDLIARLHQCAPGLPVILISGDVNRLDAASPLGADLSANAVLEKPFSVDEMVAAIRRVLDRNEPIGAC